jgi:hypothetical protein
MRRKLLDIYPVDTPANVKAASAYFDEHSGHFNPLDRVTYAAGLAEASHEFGLPLSEKVAHYAHAAPRQSLDAAVTARNYLTGGHRAEELAEITKVASHVAPEDRMALLYDFDRSYGLDRCYHRIPDPFDSVFVAEKVASLASGEDVWTSDTSDRLSSDKLTSWLSNKDGRKLLEAHFDDDIVDGLAGAAGWQVFKSLPDPHKKIITRLVNDNTIDGTISPGSDPRSRVGMKERTDSATGAVDRLKKLLDD